MFQPRYYRIGDEAHMRQLETYYFLLLGLVLFGGSYTLLGFVTSFDFITKLWLLTPVSIYYLKILVDYNLEAQRESQLDEISN
jgi:uncharacterized membrane protein YesL